MATMYSRRSTTLKRERGILGGFVDGCKEFCMYTSIHGFNHIAAPKRHWLERGLWAAVVSAAAWAVLAVALGQWQRYRDNPTVVTLEKNFRTWDYIMPAVTACFHNRTSDDKVRKAILARWHVSPGHPRYGHYERFVAVVANSDLYHLSGYQQFADDDDLDVDLYQLAVDVMPDQKVKLSASEHIPVPPKWTPVMTEVGACYTINSLAVTDVAIVRPTTNDTAGLPVTCKYTPQGCFYIFECVYLIDYYVHSAYDIADTHTAPVDSYPGLNSASVLSTAETRAGPAVRALPPRRRRCRYTDEPTERGRRAHSNALCRQGCKSRLAVKLCGCKPFYYFYADGPLCGPRGMRCVSDAAQRLAGDARCPCVQQCVDSVFQEVTTSEHVWVSGPFATQGVVRFVVQPPRTRFSRYIVFHFQDLIVSFGGAAGLFLGASLISFVEIGYFVIERVLRTRGSNTESKPLIITPKPPYECRIQELNAILDVETNY